MDLVIPVEFIGEDRDGMIPSCEDWVLESGINPYMNGAFEVSDGEIDGQLRDLRLSFDWYLLR